MRERIAAVGVETGGDQDQIGAEGLERRHQPAGEGAAPGLAGRVGRDRDIDDIADAGLGRRACARIEGRLVDGAEEQAVVSLEGGLGAVAVVDVEIDHGDPGHTLSLGHAGGDGDIGEHAEAHGGVRLGVVARRADSGEGAGGLAADHGADGIDHGAGGEAGGADAARRQHSVGVQLAQATGRRSGEQAGDMVGGVKAFEVGDGGLGRGMAVEAEVRGVEGVQNGLQPFRALGMADAGAVGQHVGVGEEGDAHRTYSSAEYDKHHALIPATRRLKKWVEPDGRSGESGPMTEPLIRPAVDADAAALGVLGRQTFLDTFVEGFGIPYPAGDLARFLDASFSPGAIRAKLQEPGAAWWVAERDGDLLAFANTGPNTLPHPDGRPSHAELRRLYVSKSAQGLGLGTKLLTVALDWMEANTDGPLWIGVWSGNAKAQKLYAAYGFEVAGEYQYPVGAWMDDEFILRRG